MPFVLGTLGAGVVVIGAGWYRHQVSFATEQKYQQLMALTPVQTTSTNQASAPDFTLVDQNGQSMTLSSLAGKDVVLEFMDPVCTDICPIVSAEIVKANQYLGSTADNVEFIAVNVNQYHESKSDAMAFSKEHGLNRLANWHFVTGSTDALKAVWKAYGITVIPNPTGDVQHSSYMYFIDKQGVESYIANPDNSKATIDEWARGIDYVVRKLV